MEDAPSGLQLIADFVNTAELDEDREDLSDPAALRHWLGEHDLLPAGATVAETDLERALEVREAIRALLLANNGAPLDQDAVATLNRAAEAARLAVRFAEDGHAELVPSEQGVPGALARILGLTYTAMADETWPRLKACRDHACMWAFYDSSKNRSRTWCSMQTCGNRTKARAYRERRRG